MRRNTLAALVLLVLPVSALADGTGYTPPHPAGLVAVYRGASANLPSPVAAVGGERIWFVDPAAGELTGCRLVATYTVGVNRVRCATTELPVE